MAFLGSRQHTLARVLSHYVDAVKPAWPTELLAASERRTALDELGELASQISNVLHIAFPKVRV